MLQSYVTNVLLLWLLREASSTAVVQHHTDTDDCTRTFGISPQIPAQGPFTFMWLMSRVFKAARSSLKLYYHWFPWKHDDETFYYSQSFMGCLLRRSTEHLPRMCSQVKPLIKRRSEFLEMLGTMESFHFSKWMLMSVWQRLCISSESSMIFIVGY